MRSFGRSFALLAIRICLISTPFRAHDLAPSNVAITPATISVSFTSATGVKLFDFETIQLTNEALEKLSFQKQAVDVYDYFGFGDSVLTKAENYVVRRSSFCKAFPDDNTWPQSNTWSTFNKTLGNALIKTVPVAAACYKNSGICNVEKCIEILARVTIADLHTNDPTSMMWPLFQGRRCMPTSNPNGTCTLGGYPSYSVKVETVAQIQLAVNFARNQNLRLVIKNTGHDYIGKSSGAGALNIWTHNLKDIQFIRNYNNSEYSGPAFKAGAGVQGFEMLEAARDNGVTILAGICETVGWTGGYLAGGGHSPLASIYGMAADQVLTFKVMTADGRFVTASNTVNSDLFWALRGGGGSTFGIVTSVIAKAHPKIKVTKSVFSFQAAPENSVNFWKAVHPYFKRFPEFTSVGTYSYFWIWNRGTQLDFQMTPFFVPNHTLESFQNLTKPLFDELKALSITFSPNTTFHEDFYPANKGAWGEDSLGVTFLRQATRLFPKKLWQTESKFEAFYSTIKDTVMSGYTVGGYHMAPGNPFNVDNAVNPAWRAAQSFLITANMVPDNATPAQLKEVSDNLTFGVMEPWRKVAPNADGGGEYLNEADIQEPNWQSDFYGAAHYSRLLAIKRKWDPSDVFYATTGVGSEEWEVREGDQGVQTQNGRLCRVGALVKVSLSNADV